MNSPRLEQDREVEQTQQEQAQSTVSTTATENEDILAKEGSLVALGEEIVEALFQELGPSSEDFSFGEPEVRHERVSLGVDNSIDDSIISEIAEHQQGQLEISAGMEERSEKLHRLSASLTIAA